MLIVLGCVLAPVSVLASWAGNEVSSADRWVATVEPLIHDPAVQNALTDKITTEIISRLNHNGVISQASPSSTTGGCPDQLAAHDVRPADRQRGDRLHTQHRAHGYYKPGVARRWVQVNTVAHQAIVKVLSGENNGTISVVNGRIVLNLGPLIVVVEQNLVKRGFSLASNIPKVSPTLALFEAKTSGRPRPYTG